MRHWAVVALPGVEVANGNVSNVVGDRAEAKSFAADKCVQLFRHWIGPTKSMVIARDLHNSMLIFAGVHYQKLGR